MEKTVFWSWQSDLDSRVTREVVRFALDAAITMLSADVEEADRPSLTSDTQGVAGTPDIVATILRKIDEAAVFVGDVTPISVSESGKACANPNVLLEMGYANRALSEHRVIQVWNTAFEGAMLDKLPFDMRGRRGPISFHLPVGADTSELRRVRGELAKQLAGALKASLDELPPPPPEAIHWQAHFPGDADLWFDRSEVQTVTNPMHGTTKLRWKPHFAGYARIIPSKWAAKPGAKQSLAGSAGHSALLAQPNSLNFGISKGGAMVYWPGTAEEGVDPTVALTQWFEKTGEIWGVGGGFLFQRDGERLTLSTGYFYQRWLHFLERNCALVLAHGGALPIHVRLGISDIRDSWWPRGPFQFNDEGYAAVEDAYEYDTTLTSVAPEELQRVGVEAFNGLAAAYGMEPFTHDQIIEQSRP
ncbi:hypothetical protein CAF53_23675 [Sphingobium sp. LB126]|uniref:hypothetical protein n=1 Tax=Sphingobium sp. LB126 TaxID=1983755 RepID=UPI000C207338|nr:hypothetical protein [Sphingobium sp. LB126]PJG45699.1 hypothetical protein CAF53_23675 [Sphingobium sp. LB126]